MTPSVTGFALGALSVSWFGVVHGAECLPPYKATVDYVGCYHDPNSPRDLSGPFLTVGKLNSPEYCANICGAAGYSYSGVEFAIQCFCGNKIEDTAEKADESQCNTPCPADGSKNCGGGNMINIYSIKNPSTSHPLNPAYPDCTRDPLCSNKVCDTSISIEERAKALVSKMSLDEKVSNVGSASTGSARLGLPAYEWQNEALHGLAGSTGVQFKTPLGSEYSAATSFPMPILMGAAFDDELIQKVASVISTEARAFANAGFAGLDFWTPNINPFRDPRWGRGMETPGEDVYHIQNYVYSLIDGLEGGRDPDVKRTISTCKHFAAYDIEDGRTANDLAPTAQDMTEFYLPPFQRCVRDAKATSVMCAYNSVYGIPACASDYLLQDILRDHWQFTEPYNYVVSDCDSIENVYDPHHYAEDKPHAAALTLNAGTDLDCGATYNYLNVSVADNLTTEETLEKSLIRLYSSLIKVGYFDPKNKYSTLSWADVNTTESQKLARRAATEGMALLKNDGTLPLPKSLSKVALIGPWANATEQMQGNYAGTAPFLVSPLSAFQSRFSSVKYVKGTDIDSGDNSGFSAAVEAAKQSDYVIYLGGIDKTIEDEGHDRKTIVWPGNQLALISELSKTGKPLVVVQFGGGQIDDSGLLKDDKVNSLVWGGYPGQDGGNAVVDVLTGVAPPAGRLPITQYPSGYVDGNDIRDMNLRPSSGIPGRTYKWYTEKPVLPFGYGLHYTNFSASWQSTPSKTSSDIPTLVNNAQGLKDLAQFATLVANVKNAGGPANLASDYVGMLFLSSSNAGEEPRPKKQLVSYGRLHDVGVGETQKLELKVTLGSLARADKNGDLYLYPGDYTLELDLDEKVSFEFSLTGKETKIDSLPQAKRN